MRSRLTTHLISSSSGTDSSTGNGFIEIGMFSPGGGTYLYSATLSAMIRSRVTRTGCGARLNTTLYHPLTWCHASWIKGGLPPPAPQPMPLPPLLAVSYLSSNSPLWRDPASLQLSGLSPDPSARRLSHQRVFTLPKRSIRFSWPPAPALSERPSVGSQRSHPPLSAQLVVGGLVYSTPLGTACAPSGRRYAGNPEKSNGLSCA